LEKCSRSYNFGKFVEAIRFSKGVDKFVLEATVLTDLLSLREKILPTEISMPQYAAVAGRRSREKRLDAETL